MIKVSVVSESEFMAKGHGVHTAYIELTNALKNRSDVEVVVNKRGSADITHLHTVGAYALFRLLFDTSKKVISAHIVPASLVGSLVGARFWAPLASVYLRWFYNRADLVFAVSDETKRVLLGIGVTKPIEVVYNVIDTSRYKTTTSDRIAAREKLTIAQDAWLVVGAGQVQPRKRIDSFVSVAKQLPDVRFIWVGGMPFGKLAAENSAMQTLIDTAPKNVSFTGVIELEDVRKYYQAADVFWLPSIQETFGLVVVEAAASGLPVMLRDIPDYLETFADAALLRNEAEFAITIEKLRNDQKFYKESQQKAATIATRFDSITGANHIVDIYHSLLNI